MIFFSSVHSIFGTVLFSMHQFVWQIAEDGAKTDVAGWSSITPICWELLLKASHLSRLVSNRLLMLPFQSNRLSAIVQSYRSILFLLTHWFWLHNFWVDSSRPLSIWLDNFGIEKGICLQFAHISSDNDITQPLSCFTSLAFLYVLSLSDYSLPYKTLSIMFHK